MSDATRADRDDLPCGGCVAPCPFLADDDGWHDPDECEHCSQPLRPELHPECRRVLALHAADVAERRALGEVAA